MRYQNLLHLSAFVLVCSVSSSFAQNGAPGLQKARVFSSVKPTVVYAKPVTPIVNKNESKEEEEKRGDLKEGKAVVSRPPMHITDNVWQKEATLSVNAVTIINQFDVFPYTGVTPADPSGDVGIDRVVTSTNGSSGSGGTRFAVYDKCGNVLNAVVTFNSLGNLTGGSGDPIIIFDNQSNRWFITEMVSSPRAIRIYVSQTPNPVGAYFQYVFPTTASAQNFPDYPKVGIWNDKFILTSNEARVNASNPADPARNVYVFNRAAMVAGGAVTPITFWTDRPVGFSLQNTVAADVDGTLNPDANSKPVLLRHRDDEINPGTPDNTKDFIEYWELDINFASPAASTMSATPIRINIAEFDATLCSLGIIGCFAQPGTGTTLTPINQMMMYRVQYRRFATHESIVMNFVTDADGNNRGGIRWCEIRKTTGSWFLYQEGTFAPNDGLNRFMGTIAQDKFGNIALGYAVTSGTIFPSLRITGRKASDPLGIMTEPEITVAAGTNSSTAIRWGDYFHLAVDPVSDENFWLNGMYATGNQLWRTRVAHFKFNSCLNPFNSTASTIQNNTCFGGGTGIITVTPGGGTAPYTYQFDCGEPQSSNTFSNLAAGTYTITVNDAAGCSSIASTTVTQPAQIGINETVQNVLCSGGNTGTVTVGVANGVAPFTYKIGTGTPQNSNVFTNLTAGTYNIAVTDANNCTNQKTVTVTQPEAITSSETKTDVSCNGGNNGTVTINAAGGTGTLQYRIGSGALQASNTFNNLTAGTYNITIADANNCTVTRLVTITEPAAVTNTPAAEAAKCFGESSGKITVTPGGGTAPYQYKIGTGALQNSNVFTGIAAGTYNVFVRDINGCETSQSVTITQPQQIAGTITAVNPDASNRFSGTLKVEGSSGTAPYQYSLNGGAFQSSGDFSGSYIIGQNTINIKDAKGCLVTLSKQIDLSVTDDTWKSFTKLYPNPNNGEFFIDIRGIRPGQVFQIQIFDMAGKQVYSSETNITSNGIFKKQLSIGNLAAGVHTMKVVSKKNKGEINIKFVVARK